MFIWYGIGAFFYCIIALMFQIERPHWSWWLWPIRFGWSIISALCNRIHRQIA